MYLLLVNRLAGGNRYKFIERPLKATLNRLNVKHKIVTIDDLNNIKELLKGHIKENTKGVVVVGGHGTVASAIDALAGYNLPIGIIPTSKTNSLARNLGIRNWQDGVKLIAKHKVVDKRLGKIGQHYFMDSLTIAPRRNLLTSIFSKSNRFRKFLGANLTHHFRPSHSVACQLHLDNELEIKCQIDKIVIILDDENKKKLTITLHNIVDKKPVISIFRANRCEVNSSLNMPILSGNETIANTPTTIQAINKTIAIMQPENKPSKV
ncbi:hypothetical protein KKE14_00770 [Patescibacteria group bacterium]|nr:hypothetical protein [Patescibacteria group bacterium]